MSNRKKKTKVNDDSQQKSIIKEIQKIQELKEKKLRKKTNQVLLGMKNKNLIK